MPVTRIKNNVVTDSNITPSKLAVTTAMQTFLGNATSANLAATVSGTTGTGNLVFANNPTFSSANVTGNLTVDTDTLFVDSANNRVGIGTTSGFGTLNIFRNVANSVINLNDTFTRAGASVRSSSSTDTTLNIAAHANNTTILQVANSNGTASYNMSLNTYGGNVGIGTTTIDTSARLQVDSTTQGFLPPRMTISQRNAIATPAAGLTVYTTDGFNMSYHNGTSWGDVFSSHSSSFTSESLRNAVSDETGSGSLVFNTGPSFVGPVNLTGQDASTADRVMTRELIAPEVSQGMWIPLSWNAPTGTANTTSTNAGIAYSLSVQSTAVAGNNRLCTVFRNPLVRLGSGAQMRFSGATWSMMASIQANGLTNTQLRWLIGVSTVATDLSAAGVAVVWTSNTTVRLQIHNGTTLSESSDFTVQSMQADRLHRFLLTFNGTTLRLHAQSYGDTQSLPRWSFIGELAGSGLPNTAAASSINFVNIATGTPTYNTLLNVDAVYFAPYVVSV